MLEARVKAINENCATIKGLARPSRNPQTEMSGTTRIGVRLTKAIVELMAATVAPLAQKTTGIIAIATKAAVPRPSMYAPNMARNQYRSFLRRVVRGSGQAGFLRAPSMARLGSKDVTLMTEQRSTTFFGLWTPSQLVETWVA